MLDIEPVLKKAVQPTLDLLRRLEALVPPSCRSLIAEIRAHLIEPGYSVEKLLRHIGARENNWLLSAFKAAVGITPWRLIQEGRLETTARLLRGTRWRVGDIVVFVGYVDMSSFARLFRQWCGLCPSEFRDRVRMAEKRAGAIPRGVFTWWFWRRCWRFELTLEEVRELIAYLEKLYPDQGFSHGDNFLPPDSHNSPPGDPSNLPASRSRRPADATTRPRAPR